MQLLIVHSALSIVEIADRARYKSRFGSDEVKLRKSLIAGSGLGWFLFRSWSFLRS